jgi:hypothetical protein
MLKGVGRFRTPRDGMVTGRPRSRNKNADSAVVPWDGRWDGRWADTGWTLGERWVDDGWTMGGRWVDDGWKKIVIFS